MQMTWAQEKLSMVHSNKRCIFKNNSMMFRNWKIGNKKKMDAFIQRTCLKWNAILLRFWTSMRWNDFFFLKAFITFSPLSDPCSIFFSGSKKLVLKDIMFDAMWEASSHILSHPTILDRKKTVALTKNTAKLWCFFFPRSNLTKKGIQKMWSFFSTEWEKRSCLSCQPAFFE